MKAIDRKKKILLTGASGLIGAQVLARLQPCFNVTSIGRTSHQVSSASRFVVIDLLSPSSVESIVEENPDIVIHCAATIPAAGLDEKVIYEQNTKIDEAVISATKLLGAQLIYFSSTIVYGYANDHYNIDEETLPKIISPYSRQKLESEQKIRQHGLSHIILRVNAPYSACMRQRSVITIFIDKALKNETISYHGSGSRMQDFTNANDIATMLFHLLQLDTLPNGIFNISSGCPVSMKSLASCIKDLLPGCQSQILPSGLPDPQEDYKASYSTHKAKTMLGWNPLTTLHNGIADLISYRQSL